MFDIEKLSNSILKTISKPIKKLADRIKKLEDDQLENSKLNKKLEEIIPLLNSMSDAIETSKKNESTFIDQIKSGIMSPDDIRKLTISLVDHQREDIEKKIPDEDFISGIVEKLLENQKKQIAELEDRIKAISPVVIPDIAGMIKEASDRIILQIKLHIAEEISSHKSSVTELFNSLPEVPVLPDISEMIQECVANSLTNELAALPKPKDGEPGKSITVDDVKPLVEELVSKAVASIPLAKDGVGASSAVIDRDGHLILTLSDGKTIGLGPVVGKDVDMEEVDRLLQEKVAAIPKPKDGLDGFGFEDLTVEYDGNRTFTFKFVKGEREKKFEFKLPNMIYKNVFSEGSFYDVGDTVTWGGSLWHCNKEGTKLKPGVDNKEWTLVAKRGRDGNEIVKLPPQKKPVKTDD